MEAGEVYARFGYQGDQRGWPRIELLLGLRGERAGNGTFDSRTKPNPSTGLLVPTGERYGFFRPSVGIGVKYRCIRVKFSLGHSNRTRLRGDLAEDLI